jgi:hypothetical protein
MVENLNSRIRVCLTNRRHLNGGRSWLGLLQFVLNHRPFVRSRCAERVGRTPMELMSGQPHEHWLTLLADSVHSSRSSAERSAANAAKRRTSKDAHFRRQNAD